jgi:hypothetical protein
MLWSRCAAARPAQRAQPLDDSPEAAHTAAVVNEASDCIRRVLEAHPANAERVAQGKPPANVVLLRGCGCRLALQVCASAAAAGPLWRRLVTCPSFCACTLSLDICSRSGPPS